MIFYLNGHPYLSVIKQEILLIYNNKYSYLSNRNYLNVTLFWRPLANALRLFR